VWFFFSIGVFILVSNVGFGRVLLNIVLEGMLLTASSEYPEKGCDQLILLQVQPLLQGVSFEKRREEPFSQSLYGSFVARTFPIKTHLKQIASSRWRKK